MADGTATEDATRRWFLTRDLAGIADELGLAYRLIGGVSVALLTWVHGVAGRVPAARRRTPTSAPT